MPAAVFALAPTFVPSLFPPPVLARLREAVRVAPDKAVLDFADPAVAAELAEAEFLITGWGCPRLDEKALAAMPRLRAVLHSAGSVRGIVTDACWERGIVVSSAVEANAVPVAEYTLAAILFSGKDAFGLRERYRTEKVVGLLALAGEGNLGRRVGVVGASRVGRRVLEMLRPFDFTVSLYDPYVTAEEAAALGAEPMGLDELLGGSDVVTLHAPDLPATYRMLDRRRLALIRDGGVLINTARGALVDPAALTDELVAGRLRAVLDVTEPEPLPADSPLHGLPNVFVTPHVSGSAGNELGRLGLAVAEEASRLAQGLPPAHPVHRSDLGRIA